jgi:hypothetical protein
MEFNSNEINGAKGRCERENEMLFFRIFNCAQLKT